MTQAEKAKLHEKEINPCIIQAMEITEAYKEYRDAPVAIREAMCLKKQFPELLKEIQPEDLFAGRGPRYRVLYVGTIWWMAYDRAADGSYREGKQGGYCFELSAAEKLPKNEEEKRLLRELTDFWQDKATMRKELASRDEDLKRYVGNDYHISAENIGFSIAADLDRLVRRGIPGLLEDVENRRRKAEEEARASGEKAWGKEESGEDTSGEKAWGKEASGEDTSGEKAWGKETSGEKASGEEASLYTGLRIALEIIINTCHYYADQARTMAEKAEDAADQSRLLTIADTLESITVRAPESFREAIQLVWIYTLHAGGKHLEAWGLDVALGDLLAHDLDHGIITQEEAVRMTQSLWRLYNENGEDATCRIMIGGKGRRNEANADHFCFVAMEATARHKRVTPQLALRFYKGQNPELLRKAYDTINESYTFPLLYNDDAVIPGVAKAFGITEETAEHYHPLGCGEYMLANASPSLLDCGWNIPRAIEAALRNGCNVKDELIGPRTGINDTLDTFEKFYEAFLAQIRFAAGIVARAYEHISLALPKDCAYLFASLLTDDCLERGKPIMDGGVRYLGGCVMGHGYSNAADSLTAIRKVVYEEKRLTLDQLVTVLDADFEGYEDIRKLLSEAPKYGNDIEAADQMHGRMWRDIHASMREAGKNSRLDFLTASSVNPGGHGMGFQSDATPDGRRKGQSYAIGNSPMAGADRSGLTALLNSLSKTDPANGGAVSNIKISREFFAEERPKLEALFGTFFLQGGMQANLSVVNRGDLEAALVEPEKYTHVLVRLGGWTARFVDLERRVQEEILERTLY